MKMIRNIAVVATLASVFAFASCGSSKEAAAAVEDTAVEAVEAAVDAVEASVE